MAKFMPFAGTMLKNLFSEPVTTSYPAKPAVYPERSRGHVEITIDQCILCGLCSRSCPPRAITVDRAGNKWTINRFDCVQCGYCTEVCPKNCLTIVPGYQTPGPDKKEATYEKPVVETEAAPAGGKPVPNLDLCVYCTLCAKKCPQEAINVDRAEKKWELTEDKCVGCGLCASNCPKKCIEMK